MVGGFETAVPVTGEAWPAEARAALARLIRKFPSATDFALTDEGDVVCHVTEGIPYLERVVCRRADLKLVVGRPRHVVSRDEFS